MNLAMRRPLRILIPLLLAAPLSGCITASIWGGTFEDDDGDGDPSLQFDGEQPGVDSVWLRILLSPLTLAADICLMPVQAYLYGWDDDDDDDC